MLIKRVPEDMEFEGYGPGDIIESRPVLRSVDTGAVLLWVRHGESFEEIMRDSATGPGPDGGASGEVECPRDGALSVDALCAHYEAKL